MALTIDHPATTRHFQPPFVRGPWRANRITAALVIALLPPLGVTLIVRGVDAIPLLVLSSAMVFAWQGVFAWWRGRDLSWDGMVTATTFALMLPADAAGWQVAIALSFGIVVGEQIFGGHGRNFLNPVVVALAFLIFSFPGAGYDSGGPGLAIASLPGAAMLILAGLISWRVVAAAAAAFLATAYLLGVGEPFGQLFVGGFVFGLIFLACDPVAAASTNPGRWVYGLIVGGIAVLERASDAGDGIVFAVLIASMFAPLIDQAVIFANAVRRKRHNA